ncbi:hypothetical protein PCL_07440 [Purpureocillium lilacinum]|uniref:NACHT domain-containing protein n=1 Tax=Purpureocillium lilacinum TaxID=33203 RepID=A0A2U3DRZ3_PURLI|nr:hypothetical protein PCL_07440 [Purpureocillium lilacinum]
MASAETHAFMAKHSVIGLQGSASNCTFNVTTGAENLVDQCRRDLFQAGLGLTDPSEHKNMLKRNKGSRAAGTCEWILQTKQFASWLDAELADRQENGSPDILWLYGNPGTGKTTISIFLAEELSRAFSGSGDRSLAYVFCDSRLPNLRTATNIVRGLLHQLVHQQPPLLKYMLPKYRERGASLFTSFDALWAILMDIAADEISGRKYCIIDALDECDRESKEDLLKQLQQTFASRDSSRCGFNIRLLITSRPYPEISEFLGQFATMDIASFQELKRDVELFIEEQVLDLAKKKNYTSVTKGQITKILEDKSEGTFLWVGLACQELYSFSSKNALKRLHDLPRGLDSLYTKLVRALAESPEWETIKRILSFVAMSLRPLSLSELSVACQLNKGGDEENVEVDEETRIQFARDEIALCRLLVVVEDDHAVLLHQSTKDFLLSLGTDDFDEFAVHASFANRCVNQLITCFNCGTQDFQSYAAQFWVDHARMAHDLFRIERPTANFCRIDSDSRDHWLATYRSVVEDLPHGYSIFHVAGRWGIPALVDYALDTPSYRGPRLEYVDTDYVNMDGVTPLEEAARSGHSNIITALLYREKSNATVRTRVLLAAARNEINGNEVMALLFDKRGDQISITEEIVKAVVQNWTNGLELTTLLLERRGAQVILTKDVIQAAAQNWMTGAEIITFLLEWRDIRVDITEGFVASLAESFDEQIMKRLLSRWADRIDITAGVINAASANEHHAEKVVALLLSQPGDQVTINRGTVMAAAGNELSGNNAMRLLLEHSGEERQITISREAVALIARMFDEEIMALLLNRQDSHFCITEDVVKGAASNWRSGEAVVSLLLRCLDRELNHIVITEDIIISAASNLSSGGKAMEILLDPQRDRVTITAEAAAVIAERFDEEKMVLLLGRRDSIAVTENIVRAAASNVRSSVAIMALLLDCLHKQGDSVTVTAEIVTAAASNMTTGSTVMALLLDPQRDQIKIAREAVLPIVQRFDERIVALLLNQLDRQGIHITVTKDLVRAVARNVRSGGAVMERFLDVQRGQTMITAEAVSKMAALFDERIVTLLTHQQDNRITITEEIVVAVASNSRSGKAIMELLLDPQRDQIRIATGAVPKVAALFDERIVALLLHRQDNHVTVTEEMVVAAASNSSSGMAIMELLLDPHGDQITVTTGAVSKVAALFDERTVALLLRRQDNLITITEEMVVAAASNSRSGVAVMATFLDPQRGHTMVTTEAVSKTAALFDERIVALLLHRQDNRITLSQDMVFAAASNSSSGVAVMKVLLDPERHQITIATDAMLPIIQQFDEQITSLLLLQLERQHIPFAITRAAVRAAADNPSSGQAIMSLLFHPQRDETTITTGAILPIVSRKFDERVVALLLERLDRQGTRVTIKEDEVMAAAGNERGVEVVKLLLGRWADGVTITKYVVRAAASNHSFGASVMALLFDREIDKFTIVSDAILPIVANRFDEWIVAHLFDRLDRQGIHITITEDALVAAAGNPRRKVEVMKLLLDRTADRLNITENVVRAAAGDYMSGTSLMALLFDRENDRFTDVSDAILPIVANRFDEWTVALLLNQLDRRGIDITITEDVLVAAAGNPRRKVEVMKLLLDRTADRLNITENVVRAAAGDYMSGTSLMALLFDRENDRFTDVSDAILPIVANRFDEWTVALLLNQLDRRGIDITITEDVLVAAAGNPRRKVEVMKLLLDRTADRLNITENVVRAAAGDYMSGTSLMALLFDRENDRFTDVSDAILPIVANKFNKWTVALLLDRLDRQGIHITITEDVLVAAAGNPWRKVEVMQFLLGRLDQQSMHSRTEMNECLAAAYKEPGAFTRVNLVVCFLGVALAVDASLFAGPAIMASAMTILDSPSAGHFPGLAVRYHPEILLAHIYISTMRWSIWRCAKPTFVFSDFGCSLAASADLWSALNAEEWRDANASHATPISPRPRMGDRPVEHLDERGWGLLLDVGLCETAYVHGLWAFVYSNPVRDDRGTRPGRGFGCRCEPIRWASNYGVGYDDSQSLLAHIYISTMRWSIWRCAKPTFVFSDFGCSLAASADLWSALNAEEWRDANASHATPISPRPRMGDRPVEHLDERGWGLLLDVGLCETAYVHGLWAFVYSNPGFIDEDNSEISGHHGTLILLSRLFLLICHISPAQLENLRKFLGRRDGHAAMEFIRSWAMTPEARESVCQAGQILRCARRMCPGTLTTIQAVAVYFATLALWAYGKAHLQFAWELQNLHACIQAGRSGVGRRSFGIHTDSVALKAYCAKSMLYTATIGAATGDPSIIWLDGADEARTQMFREHNQGVPSVRIGPRSDSRESIPLCELDQVLRIVAHILRNNLVPDGDDMPALPSVARGLEKKLLELASLSKRKRGELSFENNPEGLRDHDHHRGSVGIDKGSARTLACSHLGTYFQMLCSPGGTHDEGLELTQILEV